MMKRWKNLKRHYKLLLILTTLILVGAAIIYVWLFVGLPDINDLEQGFALPSTRIYDRYGRLLYEMLAGDATGGIHRVISLEQAPQHLIDATIATEDAHFYSNPGIDFGGIVRALWINLLRGPIPMIATESGVWPLFVRVM